MGQPKAARRWRDDTEMVQAVLSAVDAAHGPAGERPRPSPADLRARVEDELRRRRRQRLQWGATAVAFTATLAATTLVAVPARWLGGDASPVGPAQVSALPAPSLPAPLPVGGSGTPAREPLKALARTAAASAGDCGTGGYTYVHLQAWAADTTATEPATEQVSRDQRRWWKRDRSGRETTTDLPQSPPAAPAPGTTGTVTDYPAGRLPVVIPAPSAVTPLLAVQLNEHQPFVDGPQAPVRAVVDMNKYHCLDAAHRAATLRVLADTDGLRWHGSITDRAGRPGLTVTVNSDNESTRDVMVFDPDTGRLLSYERLMPLGPATSPVRTPAVIDYVLFLHASRTRHIGQTPDGP